MKNSGKSHKKVAYSLLNADANQSTPVSNPKKQQQMTQNKLHIGVYGVIIKDNSILAIRKSRGPYKGLFDLPGGRPIHGEPLEQALKREVEEETGIKVYSFSLLGNFSFLTPYIDLDGNKKELYHVSLIYRVEDANFDSFNPVIVEKDANGSVWLNRASIDEERCSPLLKKVLLQ